MSENNFKNNILKKLQEYKIIEIIDTPKENKKESFNKKEEFFDFIKKQLDNFELSDKEEMISYSMDKSLKTRENDLIIREKKFELKEIKNTLVNHSIFKEIKTIEQLRVFMSWHVFAVWDFMSLIKRLQQDLTCTKLPWLPSKFDDAARLVNEIVLGEETDDLPNKSGYMSHFNLYINAMKEINADTSEIENFIKSLQNNKSIEESLINIPTSVKEFVEFTLNTAIKGSTYEVTGSFFYGRENVIPDMFQNLLNNWKINEDIAPMFVYYLKRHIELDSGEHGPAAERIINIITENEHDKLIQVLDCAIESIKMRIKLWDGILEIIKS